MKIRWILIIVLVLLIIFLELCIFNLLGYNLYRWVLNTKMWLFLNYVLFLSIIFYLVKFKKVNEFLNKKLKINIKITD